MKHIAEAVLQYYPNHVESLSNLAVVYITQKEYDKALEVLLKAEQINPQDCIVLNNIAEVYKDKGDNKSAMKYYKLMIKYGDDRMKDHARKQMDELNKK